MKKENYEALAQTIIDSCMDIANDDDTNYAVTYLDLHTEKIDEVIDLDVLNEYINKHVMVDTCEIIRKEPTTPIEIVFIDETLENTASHVKLLKQVRNDVDDEDTHPRWKQYVRDLLADPSEYKLVYKTKNLGYGTAAGKQFMDALDKYCKGKSERLHEYFDDAIEFFEESQALVVIAENGNFVGDLVEFDLAIYIRKQS